ncbi:hypothetical protein Patl1_02531 [Pistacia atlantica]|uniref:Uncharacterized protein n=1 Tax=Pistacia atlantica TaxID=434234 RepID=A0ACC1C8W6_9ROSI|nr:hypothetical protein Patl1_02531 [Pistacia atlantica]
MEMFPDSDWTKRLFYGKSSRVSSKVMAEPVEICIESEDTQEGLYVERIRIEKLKLSFFNLFGKITIQEPTFQRIIVVYRRASGKKETQRNIYVKHFENIPMADMEIVLLEKKNPGLTPMDWVKFLVSALIGLVTLISSLSIPKADIRVIYGILTAVLIINIRDLFESILALRFAFYEKLILVKLRIYSFNDNLVAYQSLITQSVYEKQLESGRGTLLHLCDEVIQQEVKEVIVAFFMLMMKGKATRKELDLRCEELIKEKFSESCNFDVDDAVEKLEKLGIVSQDNIGNYTCVDVKMANEIIGTTTEEVVLKAKQGDIETTTP